MTIHNIYLVAACALWVLLLLVLYLKVTAAGFRRRLRLWQKSRIALAFTPGCPLRRMRRISRRLPAYARDEQLFRYICDCYCELAKEDPQYCPGFLTQSVKNILHSGISQLQDEDPIRRELLIQSINSTRLTSDQIDRFVEESSCRPFCKPSLIRLKAAR